MYGIVDTNFYYFMRQRREMHRGKKRRRKLTAEELENKLSRLDYQEYLADPSSYFLHKEHWSLDG